MRFLSARYRVHALVVIGLLSLFLEIAWAVSDSRTEISGSPASDPDLSSPFSITTQTFGFPDTSMPGIQSFGFDIPSVTNPTSAAITAQVYLSNAYTVDPAGTYVMSANRIPITGCTITVAAGFSGDFSGGCTVSAADNATLVSLGIVNTFNTTQSIVFGLGASAAGLSFSSESSDGNPDSVSVTITPSPPAAMTFVASPGVTPNAQTYFVPRFASGLTVSVIANGGNDLIGWLGASLSSTTAPATVTVRVSRIFLGPAIYNGSVTISDSSDVSVTIPISFTVLPTSPQYIQQGAKLVVSGATFGAMFQGTSVAVSQDGNTAVVGAFGDTGGTDYGAAWTYNRSSGVWDLNQNVPSNFPSSAQTGQGHAVALSADGSVFLSGGPSGFGATWVYGGPCASTELLGNHASGNPGQGSAVALSGDGLTALVGGPYDNNGAGAAWVFVCSFGFWAQQGPKLVAGNATASALQGASVALSADGNTALIGGTGDNGGIGAAWVFTRSGAIWTQQAKLVANSTANTLQGGAVALSADGNTAVVGGLYDSGSLGAAWVYTRSGTTWSSQPFKLVGTGATGSSSHQGSSVAISPDGNTVAIGGFGDNNDVGAAWIFARSGSTWSQLGTKIGGSDAVGAAYQNEVALSADGNTLLLGGLEDNSNVGAAWAFVLSGPPPTLSSINPTEAVAGASGFTLTVNGSNFLNGATVQWNGAPLPTTFGSVSQLTATVSASLIASTGSNSVSVVNPDGTPTVAATLTVIVPVLGIAKTHSGNFVKGESNATYTVTVSNAAGAASTSGTVTVTDTVPTGMTLVSMAGNGWTCPAGGATCTNSSPLSAGASYSAIAATVKIAANATSPLINLASVSGGGSATANASDSTTIVTASPCDANLDAQTNILDVQLMINEALGVAAPANNLNSDKMVNVVDVRLVVNAVLGLGCF